MSISKGIDKALAVFANYDDPYENIEGWEEIQIARIEKAKQSLLQLIKEENIKEHDILLGTYRVMYQKLVAKMDLDREVPFTIFHQISEDRIKELKGDK